MERALTTATLTTATLITGEASSRIPAELLRLDVGVLDDLPVLGDVRFEQRGRLLRIVVERFRAESVQLLLGVRLGDELPDLGGYLVYDGLRDPGRSTHALPVRQRHGRQPCLGERRHVRIGCDARLP